MKIVCIDKKKLKKYLAIDKIYDVIKINNDGNYLILNDLGYQSWFPKSWFKPLSEIRNERIDKLL